MLAKSFRNYIEYALHRKAIIKQLSLRALCCVFSEYAMETDYKLRNAHKSES